MGTMLPRRTINLPSTIALRDDSGGDFLDVNALYWKRVLSAPFLRSSFRQFHARVSESSGARTYSTYILQHLRQIKAVHRMAAAHPHHERALIYCFNCYHFVMSVLSALHRDYTFSLPYGLVLRRPLADVERLVDDPSDLPARFYRSLLSRPFFQNHRDYVCLLRWENELPQVLALSLLLRRAFDDVRVTIDLSAANEQADFSHWIDHPYIRRHVDGCVNLYSDDTDCERVPVRARSEVRRLTSCSVRHARLYGAPKLVTRLCPTQCHWHKCTFCVINSAHTSEDVCATVDGEAKSHVESLVRHLRSVGRFCYLILTDEAIACEVMCHFAEQVIAHDIRVSWIARARVSDEFTPEVCEVLARSGLRSIMFGVESVNDRIVRLMNKRDRLYSTGEIEAILDNCERSGISPHVFCLFGFPSETKREADETAAFVERNLAARPFFTFSANRFALMRGSEVYRHPEAYGIEILNEPDSVRLGNLPFRDRGPDDRYTREEVLLLTRRLYARMFFKEVRDRDTADLGYHLWDFLDRTGYFYDHRLVNTRNPYYRRSEHDRLTPALVNRCCRLIPPVHLDREGGSLVSPLDDEAVTIGETLRPTVRHFLAHYDSARTLRANMEDACAATRASFDKPGENRREWDEFILQLINSSALYAV